jgi:hypothetical protein
LNEQQYIEEKKNDILIIGYNHWGTGHFENRLWFSKWESNGDIEDYNSKNVLIADAKKHGWKYKVLRHHRNGTISIMETNIKDIK